MAAIYFDDADEAAGLLAALEAEGYATTLRREGFAGEDDWEDRAWVLVAEPSDERLAELADVHGGWLAGDDRAAPDPPDLPAAPRR